MKLFNKLFPKKQQKVFPVSKDKLDEIIEFYYPEITDMQRFQMRAMMTSFGKDCFYAGKLTFNNNGVYVYQQFIDYIKEIKKKNDNRGIQQ